MLCYVSLYMRPETFGKTLVSTNVYVNNSLLSSLLFVACRLNCSVLPVVTYFCVGCFNKNTTEFWGKWSAGLLSAVYWSKLCTDKIIFKVHSMLEKSFRCLISATKIQVLESTWQVIELWAAVVENSLGTAAISEDRRFVCKNFRPWIQNKLMISVYQLFLFIITLLVLYPISSLY